MTLEVWKYNDWAYFLKLLSKISLLTDQVNRFCHGTTQPLVLSLLKWRCWISYKNVIGLLWPVSQASWETNGQVKNLDFIIFGDKLIKACNILWIPFFVEIELLQNLPIILLEYYCIYGIRCIQQSSILGFFFKKKNAVFIHIDIC